MTLFQALALALVAAFAALTVLAVVRGRLRGLGAAAWLALWTAAALAVAWPNATVVVARRLGIGRGADLVLYVAVLCGMVLTFLVAGRLRRLERSVTVLARELALLSPRRPEAPGAGPQDRGGQPGLR